VLVVAGAAIAGIALLTSLLCRARHRSPLRAGAARDRPATEHAPGQRSSFAAATYKEPPPRSYTDPARRTYYWVADGRRFP
jgi:hypothetical protein